MPALLHQYAITGASIAVRSAVRAPRTRCRFLAIARSSGNTCQGAQVVELTDQREQRLAGTPGCRFSNEFDRPRVIERDICAGDRSNSRSEEHTSELQSRND